MANYYLQLKEWGENGDIEGIPTHLIKDYINDLTLELKDRGEQLSNNVEEVDKKEFRCALCPSKVSLLDMLCCDCYEDSITK